MTAVSSLLCCCSDEPCGCRDSWMACNAANIVRYRASINVDTEFTHVYRNSLDPTIVVATHTGSAQIWGAINLFRRGDLSYVVHYESDPYLFTQNLINIECRGSVATRDVEWEYDLTGKLVAQASVRCRPNCPGTFEPPFCNNPDQPIRDDFLFNFSAGLTTYFPVGGTITYYVDATPSSPARSGTVAATLFNPSGTTPFELGVRLINSPACEPFRCPHEGPNGGPTWGGCSAYNAPFRCINPGLSVAYANPCDEDDPDCDLPSLFFISAVPLPFFPTCLDRRTSQVAASQGGDFASSAAVSWNLQPFTY